MRPHRVIPFALPPLTPTTRPQFCGPASTPARSRSPALVSRAGTPTVSLPCSLPVRRQLHNLAATPTRNSPTPSRGSTPVLARRSFTGPVPSRGSTPVLARRSSTGPVPSPASRIVTSNQMRSVTPSHGPIRSQTSNRASHRDTTSPYPSQLGRATPQPPLRRVSTPGVSIPVAPSRLSTPGSRINTPRSAPSLSRNLTPVPLSSLTAPALLGSTTPISRTSHFLSMSGGTSNAPTLAAPTREPTASVNDFGVAVAPEVAPADSSVSDYNSPDGSAPAPANDMDMDLDSAVGWDGIDEDEGSVQSDRIQSPWACSHLHEPSNIPVPLEVVADVGRTGPVVRVPLGFTTFAAPTTAEYAINVVQENKAIMGARKSRGEPGNMVKGVRSITGYTEKEQAYMFLMRAVMIFIWTTLVPWTISDGVVVGYAKEYVKKYTDIDLDIVVTDEFVKTVNKFVHILNIFNNICLQLCSGTSRLRGEGQNLVLTLVKDFWKLKEEDGASIDYLQEKDRLTYLDHNRVSEILFPLWSVKHLRTGTR
jgi:hypothetical protein